MNHPTEPAPAHPLVTVGIPVCQAGQDVAALLKMAQAQTYPNLEIIICDDTASESVRAALPDSGRISYHAHPVPLGTPATFRQTLSLANGDYFVWATPQTRWEPGFVAELVRLLTASPQAGLAFCHADVSAGTGFIIRQHLNLQNLLPADNCWQAAQKFLELDEDSGKPLFFYGLYRTGLFKSLGGLVDCPGEWWAAACLTVFRVLLAAPAVVSPRLFFHQSVDSQRLFAAPYLCPGHFLVDAETYLSGYSQVLAQSNLPPALKSLLTMTLNLRRLSFYAARFQFNTIEGGYQLARSVLAQVTPPAEVSAAFPAGKEYVAQAMAALAQQDYPAAIAGFEDALAVNPGLWQVYEVLAALWLRQDRPHLAAAVFEQAATAGFEAVGFLTALSFDPASARDVIEATVSAFTGHGVLPLAQLAAAASAPAVLPSVDELVQQARTHRQQKQPAAAREAIEVALTQSPAHPEALVMSGLLRLDAHDRAGAELAWENLAGASRQTPGCADLVIGLVLAGSDKVSLGDFLPVLEAIQADGRWEEAAMLLKIAQSRLPKTPAEKLAVWNRLGVCYVQLGNPAEAIALFEKGLGVDPNSLDILANLAQLYYQQEEYDRATEYINRVLKFNPSDIPTLLLMGDICIRLEVFDVAQMTFEKVQALAPNTEGVAEILALLRQ